MNRILTRRIELWFAAVLSAGLGGYLAWGALARNFPIIWWLAGPCLALVPLCVWKALKPDSYFVREEQKKGEFERKYPILTALAVIGGIIASMSMVWGWIGRAIKAFG